jgi:hypothetical protein
MILNRFPWESRTGCQKSDLKLISDCILLLLSDGAGDFDGQNSGHDFYGVSYSAYTHLEQHTLCSILFTINRLTKAICNSLRAPQQFEPCTSFFIYTSCVLHV